MSAEHGFAAVLSDMGMPDDEGFVFIRLLREFEHETTTLRLLVVTLTAYTRPRDSTNMLAAGFDHYVAKPVQPVESLTTITRLIEQIPRGPRAFNVSIDADSDA